MYLLEINALKKLEAAYTSAIKPTDEQQKQFVALHDSGSRGESRLLTIAGDQAEITIHGVMTQAPDIMAMFFGGGNVTYTEIITALAIANADENVKQITLDINSPGGEFDGLFDVLAAIQTSGKPIKTMGGSVIASGAYAIAAQTDSINVKNVASRIGSIGVAMSLFVSDNVVDLASTNAPNKRPDVTTPAGKAVVVEELDAMHDIFVESIATGRQTTVEDVNANFGRGGTVLSNVALERGMIDSVTNSQFKATNKATSKATPNSTSNENINANTNAEIKTMDLSTLKLQHPETYAQVLKLGVDEERDRVKAHLIMGESYGAMKIASAAIKDGSGMGAAVTAEYVTAGRNNQDINDRESDNVQAQSTGDDIKDNGDGDDEKVMSIIEQRLGVQSKTNAA